MPSARSLRALGLLFVGISVALAPGFLVLAQPIDSAEYEKAAGTIRCDCGCHPQSVHECACGRAAEMRDEIRGLLAGGLSADEVIAHYVDLHGEQIRLAPTATGFNLVAWLGPLIVLVVASIAVVFLIRRWNRGPAEPAPETSSPVPSTEQDAVYHQRLREAMERMK